MIELLQTSSPFFIALTTVLGLLIGSFLNVVIYRLPLMMEREWHSQCDELNGQVPAELPPLTLSKPRSACPHCQHPIGALENIPVISYFFLGGKCKSCKAPISLRYPIMSSLIILVLIGPA